MIKKSPFKNFVITIGNLPTAYLESMSYYEALTFLTNYIANNITPAEQANSEAIKELQDYVTNYFNDLDVTEEIDNKLDAMVLDGTLAEVINEQLFSELDDKIDNLANQFNLNSFVDFSPTIGNMSVDNGIYSSGKITIAKNSDGSIAKIYGTVVITEIPVNGVVSLTLQNTGLLPDTTFMINPTGLTTHYTNTGNAFPVSNYCYVNNNGSIVIESQPNQLGVIAAGRITLFPCLYFIKDFGD